MVEQNQKWLNSSMEKALPKIMEEILRELIEHSFIASSEARILYQLQNINLGWLAGKPLAIIVAEVDNLKGITQSKGPREKEILLFALGNVLKDSLAGHLDCPHLLFQSRQDHWVILIGAMEDHETSHDLEQLRSLPALLFQAVEQYVKVPISTGMSAFGKWGSLHSMYDEAVHSLEKKKMYGTPIEQDPDSDPLDADDHEELTLSDPAAVVEVMKYGTEEDIFNMMSLFPGMIRDWDVHHPRDLQQRSFEWLLAVYRTAQKAGWQEDWWEINPISFWEQLEQFDTLDSLQKHLSGLVAAASRGLQELLVPQSHIVQKAEQYILQHFTENISLVMAAEHVHVTHVWLSKLFKKEKGTTFHEYLTDLRLEKAKRLLHDANLKVYHICNLVGYQDPVYFTKLFKKKYGCTPMKYRNTRGSHID